MSDPNFANVVLLAGFEDGYIDESSYARTLTPTGAQISRTVDGSFEPDGALGLYLSGQTSSLTTPKTAELSFGTGDFTIEGWARSINNSATLFHSIVGNYVNTDPGSWSVFVTNSTANRLAFLVQGVALITASTTDWNNDLHHFAICRSSGTTRLFVDGVMEASSALLNGVSVGGTGQLNIGGNNAGTNDRWLGYIDGLRISGMARYTTDDSFTVPTSAYPRTGVITVGQTLGMQNDTWTGTPTSFTYRWFRHVDAEDLTGVAITGATSATYTLVLADETFYISGEITPVNASGTGAPVRSNIVGAIGEATPDVLPALVEAGEVYEVGALTIDGTPVLTATDGVAYTGFTVTAADGPLPWVFSLVGTWPAGITINSVSGAVSGTPTEDGTFAGLSVRVTDAAGQTADLATFSIEVAVPPVASLTALNRWYDPSDATTVTLNTGVIEQIDDKSGNAYHASQGAPSLRPAVGSINGLDAINCVSNDYLVSTLGIAPFSGSDKPITMFAVIDLGADLAGARDFFSLWNSSNVTPIHVARSFSNAWGIARRDDANTSATAVNSAVNHSTNPVVFTMVFTGTSTVIRINGTAVAAVTQDVGTLTLDRLSLGAFRTTFNFFDGQIGEFILCETASSSPEIADTEAYLAAKWGITI